MKVNKATLLVFVFLTQLIFTSIAICKEAEVFFVDMAGNSKNEAEEVKLACDLLGVRFSTHYINPKNHTALLKSTKDLRDKEVLILSESVLQFFKKNNVLLFDQISQSPKILISGINANTDINFLEILSENKIKNFRQYKLSIPTTSIKVIDNKLITRELGGLEYPLSGTGSTMINGLLLADPEKAIILIEVFDKSSKSGFPIFLKTDLAGRSIFYLSSWQEVIANETDDLLKIMPFLMFIKYAFNDRCWHGVDDYANFTIDDPWLIEPYGYIHFADLCKEAKNEPFHVTISFIPYNYQKNHNDAIDTFRQCSKNLSLAIHGNNHDFSEFRSNVKKPSTDGKSSVIHPDEKNILQALYRMDIFSNKTGIPYDRVMIFPRGVFTKESLGLLKRQNFLMTINSTRPLNAENWANNVDRLRGISLQYENFPMVLRYGIPDSKTDNRSSDKISYLIQMRLFLDLPVFLYTHSSFFKNGSKVLNPIAKIVNKYQPEVKWNSLGTIAKKLYLQKRTGEWEVEVLAYASDIVIKNNYPAAMKFVVKKEEDFLIPIQSVKVNGTEHKYSQDGNHIKVEVALEPNCEKNIRIHYYSAYQVGSFNFSDSGLTTYLIRTLSDFRDIYLPKLPCGDKVVMIFYRLGGVKYALLFIFGFTGIIMVLLVLFVKNRKSKKRLSQKNLKLHS